MSQKEDDKIAVSRTIGENIEVDVKNGRNTVGVVSNIR